MTCKSFITMVSIRPLRWLVTPLDGELHQLGPYVALGSFFLGGMKTTLSLSDVVDYSPWKFGN